MMIEDLNYAFAELYYLAGFSIGPLSGKLNSKRARNLFRLSSGLVILTVPILDIILTRQADFYLTDVASAGMGYFIGNLLTYAILEE